MPRPLDVQREAHPETFSKNAEGAINSLGVFLG